MAQRPEIRAIIAEPDPREKLRMWFALIASFSARVVPILLLARGAAANDPAASTVWEQMLAERRIGASQFAHLLHEGGHLRADISESEAGDILWTFNAPEMWELLVVGRKWSPQRFQDFMAGLAIDALLAAP